MFLYYIVHIGGAAEGRGLRITTRLRDISRITDSGNQRRHIGEIYHMGLGTIAQGINVLVYISQGYLFRGDSYGR